MSNVFGSSASQPARVNRVPFIVADVILVATAIWIGAASKMSIGPIQASAVVLAMVVGAILGVLPFLLDHWAALRAMNQDQFLQAAQRLESLGEVGERIISTTSHWQSVQDNAQKAAAEAQKAVGEARNIAERTAAEAQAFAQSMQRANDQEKAQLRLEVEKLRRTEGDWLQVCVRTLDHVYALYLAGQKSGQPALAQQLGQFQGACRDAARRVGLAPYLPELGEPFDERGHMLPDPNAKPAEGSVVDSVVATGYTFQGQLLRRAVVNVSDKTTTTTTTNQAAADPS